jgi:hypothetical protein
MLEKSFIIAFIVMGIHVITTWPGMILAFVGDWVERKKLPMWFRKPCIECSICMCPWWGTLIYWIFLGNSVSEWIVVIFTAMGINSVIVWVIRAKG